MKRRMGRGRWQVGGQTRAVGKEEGGPGSGRMRMALGAGDEEEYVQERAVGGRAGAVGEEEGELLLGTMRSTGQGWER